MRHTIAGKVFCITGTLKRYTRATAESAIMDAGGEISKSVGARTDFLVCGAGASRKLTKAKSLGVPVIAEADLESFLSGEVVDVDEEVVVSGDASVRDLVGEARAALDGHPDSAMWSALVAIVDSCAPEQLGSLVDFLEPQVARWEVAPHTRWRPKSGEASCEGAPKGWLENTPRGELLVAPFRWITEMVTGHDSPKHRLVHAIHTHDLKLNGTNLVKILSRDGLVNVTSFDVHESPLSKTFWKKLRALPSSRTLRSLRVSRLKNGTTEGALGEHHLGSLERLSIYSYYHNDEDAMATLFGSEMAANVRELTVEHCWLDKVLKLLDDRTLLPNLERVVLDSYYDGYLRDGLMCGICSRVPEVALAFDIDSRRSSGASIGRAMQAWLKTITSEAVGPELLDLSTIRVGRDRKKTAHDLESTWLLGLKGWTPPSNTTRVRLGRYWTEDLAEAVRKMDLEPIH